MTAPGAGIDIPALAQQVYDQILTHLDAANINVPPRRIMVAGDVQSTAWDCECFLFGVDRVTNGSSPGRGLPSVRARQAGVTGVRHVRFTWQLARCGPSATRNGPPKAEALTAFALRTWRDVGVMAHAASRVASDIGKTLLPGSEVDVDDTVTVGPQGGYTATQSSITVSLLGLTR